MGIATSHFKVEERLPSYYSLAFVIDRHERGDESLRLYRCARKYEAVLANKKWSPMCFSLFRVDDEAAAREHFRYLYERLSPFYQASNRCYNAEVLQALMDTMDRNPEWSLAHVATQVGLMECLESSAIVESVDSHQHDKQWTPLHLAAQIGKTEVVRKLLEFNPKLLVTDALGNTPLHYAAQVSPDILLAMLKKTITSGGEEQVKEIVNAKNSKGESPLHVACQYSQDEGVKVLLESGAEVDPRGYEYPIHTAVKSNSLQCAATVLEFHPEQLKIQDKKYGGSPLHWAKSRECIELLVERGADLEAVNNDGETALHIMVRYHRLECVISLLSQGAFINAREKKGCTPLHWAAEHDDLDIVHALIVFGADINARNSSHQTPRHVATAGLRTRGKEIARALCFVGATQCDLKRMRCTTECARPFKEEFKVGPPSSNLHTVFPSYEEALGLLALAASWGRGRGGVDCVDYGRPVREEMSIFRSICGKDAVLCMDGGGIRGLILIQLLLAVEDVTGQPIAQLFDWIGGTSTGGILALAIAHGKSVRYCQGLYFNMKNMVFTGGRPYNSEPLENFLRKEFGESTVMSSIVHPKVIATSVLADRRPAVLHLFKSYHNPLSETPSPSYKAPPKPSEQRIWKAARGTGAAPTYFRAMGRVLDGGLIANNPTLDVMTEIHNYNQYLREQGRRTRELGLVLSLGTGVPPEETVKAIDVFKPEGILDTAAAALGARSLGNLLVDQVTASNGPVVERAKAWCEMIKVPFFRFTTPMSSDVGLDETSDKVLVKMLWEAQAYIYQHRNEFDRLGKLLVEAS